METENIIIQNYANSLVDAAAVLASKTMTLGVKLEENNATIKTVNVLIESVRSQTVLLQQAIDDYKGV